MGVTCKQGKPDLGECHDGQVTTTHAILLAGGRASRLGGIDKLLLQIGGQTVLERAVASAAHLSQVAIVGPERDLKFVREVIWTREDPPFSGPASAIAAGFGALKPAGEDEILVLPSDLVHPGQVVHALAGAPGNCIAVDPDGFRQWACCKVLAADLSAALTATDGLADASIRKLLTAIEFHEVAVSTRTCADLDTPADVKEHIDVQ